MLAPKEGHGCELLAKAEHVERRRLALALGDHPVLDPDRLARMRIGPARDVAGGEDPRRAGLEIRIDRHTAIDREACGFCEREPRTHADTGDNEIRIEHAATLELRLFVVDGSDRVFEMKDDAVLF